MWSTNAHHYVILRLDRRIIQPRTIPTSDAIIDESAESDPPVEPEDDVLSNPKTMAMPERPPTLSIILRLDS
jgi:hypothetical protein